MSIMRTGKILLTATLLAGPLVLAGCGGGSDTETVVPEPEPTVYETAKAAIAAATTAEAAQAAYDAVKSDVTAAEGDLLQAAVDTRVAALEMMARVADQKAALAMAAGAIDTSDLTTPELIAAANNAIANLQAALDAAADVTDADKAMYQTQLDTANTAVGTAQAALDLMGRQTAQRTAISNAVTTALAAVNAVNDGSTDAEVMAADNAIAALKMAIDDASDLPSGDSDVAGAQGTHTALLQQLGNAKTSRTAALEEAERQRQAAADAAERKRIADLVKSITDGAIKDAMDAVALVNNDSDDATVTAAQAAVTGAKGAIDAANIPAGEMATLHTVLAVHEGALNAKITARMEAQEETTRIAGVLSELQGDINAANMLVNGLNDESSDEDVMAARTAISNAKTKIAAADIPTANKTALTGMLAETTLTQKIASRNDANKAKTVLGKAMYAALAGPDPNTQNALNNIPAPTWDASGGLVIDAPAGAGALADADDPASATLVAGASVGSQGGWNGTDYAHTAGTGDAMVTNAARVYTNKGPDGTQPFSGTGGKYTLITAAGPTQGYVELGTGETPVTRAGGAAFTHSGTQTYQTPSQRDAFYVRGTYDGAPGQFRCATGCSSENDGKGNVSALGGTWHFKPDAGAMVSEPDEHYLYYGWWVRKDSNGMPKVASAFAGRFGTDPGDSTDGLDPAGDLSTITGSATYAGNAAGKFAMSNPLDGTGNGGHFTADAMLNATFSGTGAGVTGTIDNFQLNDGSSDPGWSVSLARGGLGAAGAISAPVADPTVWSINGHKAPASGTWTGTMYDELPGDPPDGDGNNIPTTVTGTFYSEFSNIGRMVGGFGADKQ